MKRLGVIIGILLASSACAQVDPQATALLVKMRAAYGSLKSLKAVGQARFVGHQKQLVVSSVVQFKAPMNFRIETTGVPGTAKPTYTLITDGKKLHVDGLPGGAYTRRFSYQELLRSLPQANLETLCFFDWRIQFSTDVGGNMHRSTFKVFQDKWSGKTWTVLEETAKDQHIFVDYYIDPATSLIWKTAVFDIGQKTPYNEFWFTKLEVNPKLDAAAFRIN